MTVHDGNYKCDGGKSIVANYSRVCYCTQHIKYNVSTETVSCLHVKSCRSLVKAAQSEDIQIVLLLLCIARVSNIERKECLTLYRAV